MKNFLIKLTMIPRGKTSFDSKSFMNTAFVLNSEEIGIDDVSAHDIETLLNEMSSSKSNVPIKYRESTYDTEDREATIFQVIAVDEVDKNMAASFRSVLGDLSGCTTFFTRYIKEAIVTNLTKKTFSFQEYYIHVNGLLDRFVGKEVSDERSVRSFYIYIKGDYEPHEVAEVLRRLSYNCSHDDQHPLIDETFVEVKEPLRVYNYVVNVITTLPIKQKQNMHLTYQSANVIPRWKTLEKRIYELLNELKETTKEEKETYEEVE